MSIIYVNQQSAGGDGSSWENAFVRLQSALRQAQAGDEIWLAQGIYRPGEMPSEAFVIDRQVSIYGGFAGDEAERGDRDYQKNLVTLSGNISLDADSYHVVIAKSPAGARLDGVTVRGGNTQGAPDNKDGGGVYNQSGKALVLENVVVTGNRASDDGGGIRNDGELTIINSTIAHNFASGTEATAGGGGLLNTLGAAATVINSTFSDNEARNGGGIRNDGELTLVNTTLSSNSGGGLLNTTTNPFTAGAPSGRATLINSTLTQNQGAGVSNFGTLTLANSIIAGNNNGDNDLSQAPFGTTVSRGHNLIGDAGLVRGFDQSDSIGSATAQIAPSLGPLQRNGGFTQTHRPTGESPAVNGGSNQLIERDFKDIDDDGDITEPMPFDQRGVRFARVVSDAVDIGAVELANEKNAPAVSIIPVLRTIAENAQINGSIKVLDIVIDDFDGGDNQISIKGLDAGSFALDNNELFFQPEGELDFETQSQYDIVVEVNDPTIGDGAEATANYSLTVEDVVESDALVQAANHFLVTGSGDVQLRLSLDAINAEQATEVLIVPVDEQGRVNGFAAGEPGYSKRLIDQARVAFSTLGKKGFEGLALSRTLKMTAGTRFGFAIVQQGSLDTLNEECDSELCVLPPSPFAIEAEQLSDGRFRLDFGLNASGRFDDIVLTAEVDNSVFSLGSNIQGNVESELIDLREANGLLSASFEVYREAAFDNEVGFFEIEDITGQVLDSQGNLLGVSDDGYVLAAMARRIAVNLTGQNGRMSAYSAEVRGGKLLSSFIVSDGSVEDLLDNNAANDPNVYFTHVGANGDRTDHVRLLGDNTFGFEDTAGGGDQDFNDIVVKASFA